MPDATPRKILVVDDEAQICGVLDEFLMERACTVLTATSGEEGFLKFDQDHPDVVFSMCACRA